MFVGKEFSFFGDSASVYKVQSQQEFIDRLKACIPKPKEEKQIKESTFSLNTLKSIFLREEPSPTEKTVDDFKNILLQNSQYAKKKILFGTENYEESIFFETIKGHRADLVSILLQILEENKWIIPATGTKNTLLHYACERGLTSIVSLFLSKLGTRPFVNIHIDDGDETGMTPLMIACAKGHQSIVDILLQYGANPSIKANGKTALFLNVLSQNKKMLDIFLKYNIKLENYENDGKPILIDFVIMGEEDHALFLLKFEPSLINLTDILGKTSLHHAAILGNLTMVALLIQNGANVEAKDSEGRTPLFWAIVKNHFLTVSYLIARKANVDVIDVNNQTVMDVASNEMKAHLKDLQEPSPNFNNISVIESLNSHLEIKKNVENKDKKLIGETKRNSYVQTNENKTSRPHKHNSQKHVVIGEIKLCDQNPKEEEKEQEILQD